MSSHDFDGEGFDGFGDVINRNTGIFGDALKENDQVRTASTRAGVAIEFYCQGCGLPMRLTIEWPEIIALKYGVDPAMAGMGDTRWFFVGEEHMWGPDIRCQKCNGGTGLRIRPDEPDRFLKDARRRRTEDGRPLLDPGAEQQLSVRAAQVAQQLRGRAAR